MTESSTGSRQRPDSVRRPGRRNVRIRRCPNCGRAVVGDITKCPNCKLHLGGFLTPRVLLLLILVAVAVYILSRK